MLDAARCGGAGIVEVALAEAASVVSPMRAGLKEALLGAETQSWEPELLQLQPGSAPSSQHVPGQASWSLGFALHFKGHWQLTPQVWCRDMTVGGERCGEARAKRRKPHDEVSLSLLGLPGSGEAEIPVRASGPPCVVLPHLNQI